MNISAQAITQYFRSIVAANSHSGIDFKTDAFYILNPEEIIRGQIDQEVNTKIFIEANKSDDERYKVQKNALSVLICMKTVKTIFEAYEKTQDAIDELTGIYFIPAILYRDGKLAYNSSDKKVPWFPREYLQPMVEPKLSVGHVNDVDRFISNHVDRMEQMKTWGDYVTYFKEFYEHVTKAKFEQNEIPSQEDEDSPIELENHAYLFIDHTVNSSFHIMNLYNHLLKVDKPLRLYDQFVSREPAKLVPLLENDLANMKLHSGQMGGEYPLSPSQREAINHFNHMQDGEILAVNGPPGTGKTTLLQSVVADLYVQRALKQEKAPLIVAASTNNQAVTNIITSFGNLNKVGISNLEERWIEGVKSFATYFPSTQKIKEAQQKGYQYTNSTGEYFIANLEAKENIEKSKIKLLHNCNLYFGTDYTELSDCQKKLHDELVFMEAKKQALLILSSEAKRFLGSGTRIDTCLQTLEIEMEPV